jgi:hypothetical protein
MNTKVKGIQVGLSKIVPAALLFCSLNSYSQEIENYFSEVELAKANTAENEKYMSVTERASFKVLNLARMYPKKFLKYYYAYAKAEGKDIHYLRGNYFYKTLEDKLRTMTPVAALYPDKNMFELAHCWAVEAGTAGITGHNRKNCKGGYYAECCTYGRDNAVDIVMSFLIDENVKSLGHRSICLDPSYGSLGISKQDHKVWGSNTVFDLTYGKPAGERKKEQLRRAAKKKKGSKVYSITV